MRPETFVNLAIAAAATGIIALVVHTSSNRWSVERVSGEKLVPALAEGKADVASVVVAQAGKAITLVSREAVWGLQERSGYPADPDKIRELVLALSKAELVETKTRKAEHYDVLELGDPGGKDAKSRAVRVLGPKGEVIADLVVGKRRYDAFGTGKSGTYVRRVGDAQAWLANAEIDPPVDVRSWIRNDVLSVPAADIRLLTVTMPGEAPLRIERGEKDGKAAVAGLPEGAKLKDAGAAEAILSAAASLSADDVRSRDSGRSDAAAAKVAYTTKSGLEITLTVTSEGETGWIAIDARGDGAAKSEAEAIAKRTRGFEFNVQKSKVDQLLKKQADLLQTG